MKNKETHTVLLRLNQFILQLIQEDLADIRNKIQLNIQTDCCIYFDEAQLRQVLINLIRNAIRHNDIDMPHIEVNIYPHEQKMWLDVRDFGQWGCDSASSFIISAFFQYRNYWNWFRIIPCTQLL